ncbi:glutathione ABC transporter substrate-binding protein [Geomicrobium sediminis]|uniref:Peptide/nickel transport system substrate-binding protein n=1 Tax=Geomicrobium sediminis TaxID=1347788 RepID=A0ABS2PI21_9BACL|nr:glutathione ABC transporter substrate-binding protein [Geomicrobium sediminis]MBM7635089.1 peptide/nickel transport system substrate-binding protein [Geomicrobium sediminis]
MKKQLGFTAATTAFAFALVGCSDDAEPEVTSSATEEEETVAESEAPEGGDFILAVPADAVTVDPHMAGDVPSNVVNWTMYETLVERDEDMELVPGLASDYEQLDELTWEFTLREDVTFHDGEPFNAEAVKVNIERALSPETAAPRADYLTDIEEVVVVDDYTVQIITEKPFAPLIAHLAHNIGSMISPAAIEGDVNLDIEAVGTGPFKFENWSQGDELVITKNEDYWGEHPHLNSVTFKVVPEESTRIAMIENGEADAIERIEPVNISRVEGLENAEPLINDTLSMTYLGFNTQKEPLDDVAVRQAISKGIDTEVIIEGIYEGYASEATGPINDLVFGSNPDQEPIDYDPEGAEQLLEEAGFSEGELSINLWTNDADAVRVQIAEVIQDQLSLIGVNVTIENMEWAAYLDALTNGEHDLFLLGWSSGTVDADATMFSLFHSENQGAPGNRSFYTNDEFDSLIEEARNETDIDEREQLYHQALALLAEEVPVDYISFTQNIDAVGEHVDGFKRYANSRFVFDEVTLEDTENSY